MKTYKNKCLSCGKIFLCSGKRVDNCIITLKKYEDKKEPMNGNCYCIDCKHHHYNTKESLMRAIHRCFDYIEGTPEAIDVAMEL